MAEEPEWFRKEREAHSEALRNEGFLNRTVRHGLWNISIAATAMARAMQPKADYTKARD